MTVWLLSLPIWGYRWLISPWIGPRCRYLPTCSDYALDALARHGAIRGGRLAARRIIRCHPWGGSGFDPVPPLDQDASVKDRSASAAGPDVLESRRSGRHARAT